MTTDLSACFHSHLSSSAAGSKMILGFWAPLSLCNNLHAAYLINLDGILKSRDIILPTKVHLVKGMVFPVVMYGCDYKESWAPKNWCFRIVVLEKTLESPWDCKEIKPVNPKENLSCMFIGRTDAEAETPVLWPPDVKNWPTGKDPDAGKDWRQKEKRVAEDEIVTASLT